MRLISNHTQPGYLGCRGTASSWRSFQTTTGPIGVPLRGKEAGPTAKGSPYNLFHFCKLDFLIIALPGSASGLYWVGTLGWKTGPTGSAPSFELTSGLSVIRDGDRNRKPPPTCKLCQRGLCGDDHRWRRSEED